MIIFTSLIALIAIFLFALVWQNKDGTSGISWWWKKRKKISWVWLWWYLFLVLAIIAVWFTLAEWGRHNLKMEQVKCPECSCQTLKNFLADTGMASEEFLNSVQ